MALSGACVSVSGVSYSNVTLARHRVVREEGTRVAFLHLTDPSLSTEIEVVADRLRGQCHGELENVATTVTLREFLVVQAYTVSMTAQCRDAR